MKLKSQSGRSIVEMLGVLAIVGVLSVGGIAGYSYGMDKHKANQTINDIMLMGVNVIAQLEQGREADLSEWGEKTTVGYDVKTVRNPADISQYGLQISGVPSRICKMIGDGLKSKVAVYVGNADYEPDEESDPCDASEENVMEFYFGDTTCDPACDDGEICVWGECLSEEDLKIYTPRPSCSTNDDCSSMGECYGCSSGYCYNWVLNGQSCQDDAGTCQKGQCHLEKECSSNRDCTESNQYCADSNARNTTSNPTKCADILLVPHEIIVDGDTQYVYASKTPVTWWDAKSMCEAKGLKMVSVSDLVEEWSEGETANGCTYTSFGKALRTDVFPFTMYIWTEDVYSKWHAHHVKSWGGHVEFADRNTTDRYYGNTLYYSYAVCR